MKLTFNRFLFKLIIIKSQIIYRNSRIIDKKKESVDLESYIFFPCFELR